ncbi:MAG: alkaline phosphatase family protein [Limnochordaceae bacterium]|nr:alkaline phosphatase family protein [Limnochordaceae bacterium]
MAKPERLFPQQWVWLRLCGSALLAVATLGGWGCPARAASDNGVPFSPSPEHVIMVMLDGFRPDYLLMYDAPHLLELARSGVWVAEARDVFPSTTVPNQYSFVTGAYPATHGLPNNSQFDRTRLGLVPGPLRDNHAVTIAAALAQAGLTTVSVNHFPLQADPATFYVTGGVQTAVSVWRQRQPTLLVFYEALTDDVGHQKGPFSAEMRAAVAQVDDEVGQLVEAVRQSGLSSKTLFVIASDHGMSQQDEPGLDPSLDEVLRQGGYTFTGDEKQIGPQTDIYWLQYGSAFLYLLPGRFSEERYRQLVNWLRERLPHAQVLDRQTLAADYHADPNAVGDIVVVPEPGYSIGGGVGTGGLHGRAKEQSILLVFAGAGVRSGQVWPRASIVDVVPTVLAALGVPPPPTVDGKALTGILDRPDWKWALAGLQATLRPVGSQVAPAGQGQQGSATTATAAAEAAASTLSTSGAPGTGGSVLLWPVDVAASGFYAANSPALAADDNPLTFWVSQVFPTAAAFQPQFLAFDLGRPEELGQVRLIARRFDQPVGPAGVEVWVGDSPDPASQREVLVEELPALVNGVTLDLPLPAGTKARYVRLVFPKAFNRFIQLAEVHFLGPGGAGGSDTVATVAAGEGGVQ